MVLQTIVTGAGINEESVPAGPLHIVPEDVFKER
jgi:hypothetical protein